MSFLIRGGKNTSISGLGDITIEYTHTSTDDTSISLATTTYDTIAFTYILPESQPYNTVTKISVYHEGEQIKTFYGEPNAQSGVITLTGLTQAAFYNDMYIVAFYPTGVYSKSNMITSNTLANSVTEITTQTTSFSVAARYTLPTSPSIYDISSVTISSVTAGQSNTITGQPTSITLYGLSEATTYNDIIITLTYSSGVTSTSSAITATTFVNLITGITSRHDINSVTVDYNLLSSPTTSNISSIKISSAISGQTNIVTGTPTSITLYGLSAATEYNDIIITLMHLNDVVSTSSAVTAITDANLVTEISTTSTTNSVTVSYTLPTSPSTNDISSVTISSGTKTHTVTGAPTSITLFDLEGATTYNDIVITLLYLNHAISSSIIATVTTLANEVTEITATSTSNSIIQILR